MQHLTHNAHQSLCGSHHLLLVGVVTAVNNGNRRASLARQWLRALSVNDHAVPVLPFSDFNSAGCPFPPGFNAAAEPRDLAVGDESDTPRALLELMCRFVHVMHAYA